MNGMAATPDGSMAVGYAIFGGIDIFSPDGQLQRDSPEACRDR